MFVDEIKLSQHLSVTTSARIDGVVDLGPFTTEKERTLPCDHGMPIMFSPFVRKWTQILAVWATHRNMKGDLLAKVLIEAVLLAEDAGLFVDFITCDGATCNRNMWKELGIEATAQHIKSRIHHPKDRTRFLHFVSDFPHLIKCLRNNLLTHDFETRDGEVSFFMIHSAYISI
ncbi:hypothetical protein HPB48_023536 [Haemaphysalis longicornis]|uniref:Transposable element P transposase-like RNase H domain-containing protein n=1 Tax=Haemaphysalis longicornis TaxID=44386 RepID=A0A9J6GWQ4_HAELO|nr:hypothetical protein HPB48_023536 [Haemaphysalis longicornis]